MISIVTDTACDLPYELVKNEEISIIPLSYTVNGKEIKSPIDNNYNEEEFYKLLISSEKITTSQISPGQYIECFTPLLNNGNDVLFIGLSSNISGSYQSGLIAKEMLMDQYPNQQIEIFDSYGASLGIGLLVMKTIEYRKKNYDLKNIVQLLLNDRSRLYQIIAVNDLKYLNKTGRISSVVATIGSTLKLTPLLKGGADGQLEYCDKVRGQNKLVSSLVDKMLNLGKDIEKQTIGILYSNNKELALLLKEKILEKVNVSNILINRIDPVLAIHVGPNSLGFFFWGDEKVRYQ